MLTLVGSASAQPASTAPGDEPPPPPVPGLEGADFRPREAALRPEGTFLVRQQGVLVSLRSGDRAVVFQGASSDQTQGRAERPMLLAPTMHLTRLEELAAAREPGAAFLFTGQVMLYRGMNYLLLTVTPTLAGPSASVLPSESSGPSDDAVPADDTDPEAEASEGVDGEPATNATGIGGDGAEQPIDRIIADLERRRVGQRALHRGEPAESGDEGSLTRPSPSRPIATEAERGGRDEGGDGGEGAGVMQEGSFVSRRVGRLVRLGTGEWAIALEGDSDAPPPPPIALVPCAALERMENTAGVLGQGLQVQVSGRVTVYGGQNYLVPTLVRFTPPSDVKSRQ